MNGKPFYEHDEIVYNAVEKINNVLNQYTVDEKKIEYNNNRVDIEYFCGTGYYQIVILDYSEEEIETLEDNGGWNMFVNQDECITIDFWRNDKKMCTFYGDWLRIFLEEVLTLTLKED